MKKPVTASAILILITLLSGCNSGEKKTAKINATDPDTIILEHIFPFQSQHCHGSSIVELPNKDLMVAWFQGSGERTADDVAIKGARRYHKTGKWSEPFTLADVPDFPDINPVLFLDGKSRLWLVWYTVMAYQWESSILKYRISENYMQESGPPEWKWQDMIHMKPDGSVPDGIVKNDQFVQILTRKYDEFHKDLVSKGFINNEKGPVTDELWERAISQYFTIAKGTRFIATGTDINEKGERVRTELGFPLHRRIGWQSRNKPLIIGNRMLLPLYSDGFDFSLIAITDNWGETWHFSEPIVGAGSIQPSLALRKDSSIVAYMRDNGPPPKRLAKSISSDRGKTWSMVEDSDIPNPGTAADVIVLKSGNWALVHNDIEEGRHRLSVWLSKDEGKTWPHRKILVNGTPGSETRGHYPAIIQGNDGIIHVSYTNQIPGPDGQPSLKNIVHACFSEKWLTE
jgi:predicted neuraminidase